MRKLRRLFVATVLFAFAFAMSAPVAQAAEVDLFTHMSGSTHFPNAHGFSEYDRSNSGREVEVRVTHLGKLAGKRVKVIVNGHKVGRILVSSVGVAHREWDTEHGQRVPFASAGDKVKVRTLSGTLVAKGTYHLEVD
jgi:hypothetical protein